MTAQTTTRFLEIDGGRIAYDDTADLDGPAARRPLVICTPGLGDTRATYRHLRPLLAGAGYRVVTVDLRGQGESTAVWADYSTPAVAADIVALARHLDAGPVVLLSNSYTGGPSFIAATQAPDLVAALVLTSPFARHRPPLSAPLRAAQFAVGRVTAGWIGYWSSLFKTRKPADFAAARKALAASMREPGRMAALRGMLASSQAPGEAAAPLVRCPVLVVMGTRDPDFKDPAAEGALVAGLVRDGRVHLVEGAGHYPQTEFPRETADAVVPFIKDALATAA
ncbi:alpha/beta hydrolase [Actinocrinis puniceicyclus]|uniref:Alpha/beta hydrolase n=1 Tax=Actinocrinis puniceicyclus TaxID=977794 RepID=A0A8J8BDF1_9ACTN|nr:alpha/beta hydrolase [Actinocrinis puniceicyclus]MBS2966172.1 alpha/beta hydrolase [Actinocrinis puniceicyclus]